jgi:hypothetical protein
MLIESFISLCIIETVGAIFREYKPCEQSDLSPECQKFMKMLFAFFSKEKATTKPIVSFDRVYQKTSKDLGVYYTSVHRIMNGKQGRITRKMTTK